MMYLKENFTGVVASSLNFESLSENSTLAFNTQMVKIFYSQDKILQQMFYEIYQ